jgi:hypothetical protein
VATTLVAQRGLGIAYLPDFAIGRQPRDGVLLTVLDDYTDRSGPLRVMAVEPSSLSQARAFVDFLAANLVPTVGSQFHTAGGSSINGLSGSLSIRKASRSRCHPRSRRPAPAIRPPGRSLWRRIGEVAPRWPRACPQLQPPRDGHAPWASPPRGSNPCRGYRSALGLRAHVSDDEQPSVVRHHAVAPSGLDHGRKDYR